jgi:hypothetical protein
MRCNLAVITVYFHCCWLLAVAFLFCWLFFVFVGFGCLQFGCWLLLLAVACSLLVLLLGCWLAVG